MRPPSFRETPVLVGCTASGKTRAALELADLMPIEVISADSRQIYRGMDIGTAKPTLEESGRVPHHLVDILDPDRSYSAGDFARDAAECIEDVRRRGRVPLVLGGTGLYVMALTGFFDDLPGTEPRLRSALAASEEATPGFLRRALTALDPASAARIRATDTVRTVRALEITLLLGRRASEARRGGAAQGGFAIVLLDIPGEVLRKRIRIRTRRMVDDGLEGEVRALAARGYGRGAAPGRTIGYAEMLDFVEGRCTLEEAVTRIETNTWRFARRQRNMLNRLRCRSRWDGCEVRNLAGLLAGGGN
jgi:tRNA dimethylallyltransferase